MYISKLRHTSVFIILLSDCKWATSPLPLPDEQEKGAFPSIVATSPGDASTDFGSLKLEPKPDVDERAAGDTEE